jgi:hypothetical protein
MSPPDKSSKPAPLETGKGEQRDDNIDDMGRRQDGTSQDQPVDPAEKPSKSPKDRKEP